MLDYLNKLLTCWHPILHQAFQPFILYIVLSNINTRRAKSFKIYGQMKYDGCEY